MMRTKEVDEVIGDVGPTSSSYRNGWVSADDDGSNTLESTREVAEMGGLASKITDKDR